jgi:DNA-directed RNA polymerase sigma subunit (sigma70/sigma32)
MKLRIINEHHKETVSMAISNGISIRPHEKVNDFIDEVNNSEFLFDDLTKSKTERGRRIGNRENHESLKSYFNELSREPLLKPKEEKKISATMKKCYGMIAKTDAMIARLLNQRNQIKGEDEVAEEKILLRNIRCLKNLSKSYAELAKFLRNRFITANLRLVLHLCYMVD